jgi:hypothetical protein
MGGGSSRPPGEQHGALQGQQRPREDSPHTDKLTKRREEVC